MSTFYKCDRCLKPTEHSTFLRLDLIQKHIDLCDECYTEFREFMNEKNNIHLFKKPFPINFDTLDTTSKGEKV